MFSMKHKLIYESSDHDLFDFDVAYSKFEVVHEMMMVVVYQQVSNVMDQTYQILQLQLGVQIVLMVLMKVGPTVMVKVLT